MNKCLLIKFLALSTTLALKAATDIELVSTLPLRQLREMKLIKDHQWSRQRCQTFQHHQIENFLDALPIFP